MDIPDYGAGLTDEQKLAKRTPIANSLELLMRGWWLGVVVPHNEQDQQMYDAIVASLDEPPDTPTSKVPIGIRLPKLGRRDRSAADSEGHRRISDDDFLTAFNELMYRADLLHTAYARGMFVASTDEQQVYMDEVDRELNR